MGGKPRIVGGALSRTLAALAPALARHPGDGMIIGGIAVIAWGVPRVTRDIDLLLAGAAASAGDWIGELGRAGLAPRIPDAIGFAAESHVLLLRHVETTVDVDVSLASLPFELEAIAAAARLSIGGVELPVARPEDLVIFKAIAWRPQDQQDVERLLMLHGAGMDLARVRRRVGELAEALEVDRLADLEGLLARAARRG